MKRQPISSKKTILSEVDDGQDYLLQAKIKYERASFCLFFETISVLVFGKKCLAVEFFPHKTDEVSSLPLSSSLKI